MKKLLPILFLMLACNKNDNNSPSTPSNQSTPSPNNNNPNGSEPDTACIQKSMFIPHWYGGDTLIGYYSPAFVDTIFTKVVNDTSFIVYNGKTYYIWLKKKYPEYQDRYMYVALSTTYKISSMVLYDSINSVNCRFYKAPADDRIRSQRQRLTFNVIGSIGFKANNGFYSSRTIHE